MGVGGGERSMGFGLRQGVVGVAVGLAGCGFGEVERCPRGDGGGLRIRSAPRGRRMRAGGYSSLRVVGDRPYVGLEPMRTDPRGALPSRWREPNAVTVPLAGASTAGVLAARLREATGLGVRFVGAPSPAAAGRSTSTPADATGDVRGGVGRPAVAGRRHLDRAARRAAGRVDGRRGLGVALRRGRRGPHRDRAPADGGVPRARPCRPAGLRGRDVDPRPGGGGGAIRRSRPG